MKRRKKYGSIRKKPDRKTGTKLTKNIPIEGLNDREVINKLRPETSMETVIGEKIKESKIIEIMNGNTQS